MGCLQPRRCDGQRSTASESSYIRREHGLAPALHCFADGMSILRQAEVSMDIADYGGSQPLHLASQYHDTANQITLLVNRGADIEAGVSFPGPKDLPTRPLQQARYGSQAENVQTLLRLGVKEENPPVRDTMSRHI